MHKISAAKKALALVCAVGLLAAAPLALAGGSGYLGVVLQEISPSMAKALQLGDSGGVLVSEVVEDSPAEKAGLMAGDVIIKFAGASLDDDGTLTKAVRATQPGDEADLVILREGKERTITVVVGEREDDFAWTFKNDHDFELHGEDGNVWVQSFGDDEDHKVIIKRMHDGDHDMDVYFEGLHEDRGFLGVHLDDVEGQMKEFFEVEGGALVTGVVEESAAAKAGLKAGDIIVRIGDEDIADAADVHGALAGTEAEQELKVEVVRKGKNKSFDVTLGEMPEDAMASVFISEGDDFHIMAPKMIHRMPHMSRQFHVAPHVEVMHDLEIEKEALEEMKMELEAMREELEQMKQELKNR
jgi:membrane-associated protease RseP (regulator of RpoE activity)